MILKIFSVLVLASLLIYALKHKGKAKLLFGFSFLMLFAFSLSPVADYLINQVQAPTANKEIYYSEKNVIVVLGGGSSFWPDQKTISANLMSYSRITKAFQLYQNCKRAQKAVCHILVTGGDPHLRGSTEFELIAQELVTLGATTEDIIKEDRSRSTKENAFYSSELIRNGNYSSIILVTSGYHIARAERWFLHFKISSQLAPSDTITATHKLWPSSLNIFYSDLVIHELLGWVQLQLEQISN